jgi:hypothetical protein
VKREKVAQLRSLSVIIVRQENMPIFQVAAQNVSHAPRASFKIKTDRQRAETALKEHTLCLELYHVHVVTLDKQAEQKQKIRKIVNRAIEIPSQTVLLL